MNIKSKATSLDRDRQLMSAIDKYLRDVPSIMLHGVAYTPALLKEQFQARVDAINTTIATKQSWAEAVKHEKEVRRQVHLIEEGLGKYVRAMFGKAVAPLQDFLIRLPILLPRRPRWSRRVQ
jgi:hypothetical protein